MLGRQRESIVWRGDGREREREKAIMKRKGQVLFLDWRIERTCEKLETRCD